MPLPPAVAGTTVVVTGASSGIGAELAHELAGRGHHLTLVARRRERLDALADELTGKHSVRIDVHRCDLGDPAARSELIKVLRHGEQEIIGLCNSAGFGTFGHFIDLPKDRERSLIEVDLIALYDLTTALLPELVGRGGGAILNIGSSAGFQPFPGHATYGSAKAFVNHFSQALHQELSGTGVSCTVVCPGPVGTEFFDEHRAAFDASPRPLRISPATVARLSVDAMVHGRRIVVPGVMAKTLVAQARFLPRPILLRLWDHVMTRVSR